MIKEYLDGFYYSFPTWSLCLSFSIKGEMRWRMVEVENSHMWSIVLIKIWELPKRTHDCWKCMECLYTLPPTLCHTLSHYQQSTQIIQTPSPVSKSNSTSFLNKPKLHFYCL